MNIWTMAPSFSLSARATSDRSGHFTNAVAIDVDEAGNIYILDKERAYVQLFFPTEFANATHEALYNRKTVPTRRASRSGWIC